MIQLFEVCKLVDYHIINTWWRGQKQAARKAEVPVRGAGAPFRLDVFDPDAFNFFMKKTGVPIMYTPGQPFELVLTDSLGYGALDLLGGKTPRRILRQTEDEAVLIGF